jgi:dTDP-4-dehydrorhamnose 3,5-epimerase
VKLIGVQITPLRKIPDERGAIFHMLRRDDPHFEEFGEIYFSVVYPGAIKGWHKHTVSTSNYAVVTGMVKLVLYDDRPGSETHGGLQEIFLGDLNYALVRIPSGVWNGVKGIGSTPAIIANCATHPHDPEEMIRLDPFDASIPYDWRLKNQ